jgi:hypothetical protein
MVMIQLEHDGDRLGLKRSTLCSIFEWTFNRRKSTNFFKIKMVLINLAMINCVIFFNYLQIEMPNI